MIAIKDKTLHLTPRKLSDKPELEFPLQFGYVCPACDQVIHGAFQINDDTKVNLNHYAEATIGHHYPLSWEAQTITLMNGVKGQIFWEDGHFVNGYDPHYHGQGKIRCKFSRGWHQRSPRVTTRKVWDAVTKNLYVYVAVNLREKFEKALLEDPTISVPFLDVMSNAKPQVFTKVNDACGESVPIYLLVREGLTHVQMNDILEEVLTNS